ncbi:uncharacterized protein ATC70_002635 [Mucor velutinosus]|uniref:histone deacetylase n=1 Tax=Mucor velutinosus TaxID=708070 RepID=A0AAN7DCN8_9FUNG|nr:hypothetical protein ATC70_002635 [Mucor velutinosus]
MIKELVPKPSHSSDALPLYRNGESNSPSYYTESDSNLSTGSSTGSTKRRRRSTRLNSLGYQKKTDKKNMALAQKKFKKLDLAPSRERSQSWSVGDRVEAIKWADDVKEWYCARIVEITKDHHDETLVFVHYEGWPPEEADWISPTLLRVPQRAESLRYGPAGAESDRSWRDYVDFYNSKRGGMARQNTGIVQDRRMGLHCCPCHSRETIHPERPDRIGSILQTFHTNRMLRYFKRIHARETTTQELLRVHTFSHVRNYYPLDEETMVKKEKRPLKITSIAALLNPEPPKNPCIQQLGTIDKVLRGVGGDTIIKADQDHINRQHRRFSTAAAFADASQSNPQPTAPPTLVCKMTCGELGISVDTTFHPLYTSLAAKVAAGALLSLVEPIVQGQLRNGFALIRPPGHHAEDDLAMGFCFYNNVAVAVADTLEKYPSKIKRAVVIDWDIHHGNGTQKIFYDNQNVLYISVHRWDHGKFYPFSGAPSECGEYEGIGKNVNIAFSESNRKPKPMGDTEFAAAFYHFVIPIVKQFGPDMIFVSAGFDAAEGHPENLGGYNVTPRGYALLTKMVKDLAEDLCEGRLVLTLEGGYELQPLAKSCAASVAQLFLPNTIPNQQITTFQDTLDSTKPNRDAIDSFQDILRYQKKHWHFSEETLDPDFTFSLPDDWRATDSITTRPRRDKKAVKTLTIESY